MLRQIMIKTLIGLALCFVATGCATPKAAHDLAKVTSTNASLVETKIINFNKSSEEIYKGRTDAAEKLSQAIERSRTELDAYLEAATSAATISGASKNPHYGTVVTELRRVSAAIQAQQAAAFAKRGEFRAATLAEYIKLDKPPEELSIIATNLASLAEEPSDADQLESLQKFFKATLDGLKKKPNAAGPATGDAGAGAMAKSMIDALEERPAKTK
ncbi:MAG: hypothetical protein WCZ86_08575 [Desulfurivibrionaceae bacterium]|jgi:hypothetical protein